MAEAEETYRQVSSLPGPELKPLYALFLFKMGKQDAAIVEFERLAKQAPNDRDSRTRLVAAYRAAGKTQAAQNLLDAALKNNQNDTDALFQRASLFLQTGKATEAEQDLKRVLHFKSDFAEAHLAMAQVHKLGRLRMSERQELNEALRIKPSLLPARVALARSFTLGGDAKAALELLNAAPAEQKAQPAFLIERNWALLGAGDVKELRSVLDQALQIRRLPDLVLQDAILRVQQGDFVAGRSAAEEILGGNPEDVRAVRILVDSYVSQKQPGKATERLQALVAAHPQSVQLQQFLGEWYLNSKNPAAARQAFETALHVNPRFVPSALALSGLDYREKRAADARQRLQAVLSGDPKNVPALLMLGDISLDGQDRQEAIGHYRAVLAIDSSNLMALNNLAYTLALTDPEEALKYAQQAAEMAPGNAAVQDTLGWVYYRKAIYSMATTHLEAAVAKEATPRRQFHLAMSYLRGGNRQLGEKTLRLALQQDPNLQTTEKGW
jgi:tetratricopeptide (TPR) repeat protein